MTALAAEPRRYDSIRSQRHQGPPSPLCPEFLGHITIRRWSIAHLTLGCPTVAFQRRLHEILRNAQAVLGYPGEIVAQLALAVHTACHDLIFAQPHHSIRSNIGSVNGNAETLRRRNRFSP